MRLSNVLSKPPKLSYETVDGFLVGKQGNFGQKVDLDVGTVALNYFCVMSCNCGSNVEAWFLVDCEDDITSLTPKVRILKRSEKLSSTVRINNTRYGQFDSLLNKAEQAYREELGAGAIVYLRKIFEMVTVQTADSMGIEYSKYEGGNPKNFSALLEKVDAECSIIPIEFSKNGKRLFKELSNVVHGDFDEELGLKKFEPLHRLVIGILENVRNKEEFKDAKKALGWPEEDEVS